MSIMFKALIAVLCFLSFIILYSRDLSSMWNQDVAFPYLRTPEPSTPSLHENGGTTPAPNGNAVEIRTPKILQASMMFGKNYLGLNERTLQSHAEHAQRWGYGDHVLTREIVGAGAVEGEGVWKKYIFSKILYILKIMIIELERPREERAEWIVWYDADTLILNPNIQWEIFLPPTDNDSFSDVKILATKDHTGFNAGLFFCRVDEWVVDVLTDAYALPRHLPKVDVKGNIEQNAMKWMFRKDENQKHVVYQPSGWYNWFSTKKRPDDESKGDMIIHFSGINHDNEGQLKKAVMNAWFDKVQSDPDAWQVPLEKTRYPKEVPLFWELLREAREMLSVIKDRGDSKILDVHERTIQLARNELKWAVEEEAYDRVKLSKTMHDMVKALQDPERPERPEEMALVKAYEKAMATGTLSQGLPDGAQQNAILEAIPATNLATKGSHDPDMNPKKRFRLNSPETKQRGALQGAIDRPIRER